MLDVHKLHSTACIICFIYPRMWACQVGYHVKTVSEDSGDAASAVQPAPGPMVQGAAKRPGADRARVARAIQVRLLSAKDAHALLLAAAKEGPPLDLSLQLGQPARLPGSPFQLLAAGQPSQRPAALRRQHSAELGSSRGVLALSNGGSYDEDDGRYPMGSSSVRHAAAGAGSVAAVSPSYRPGSAPSSRAFSGYAAPNR